MVSAIINSVLDIAHKLCALKLNKGDTAVDCTMGNGHDTAFLCRLVGEEGKVYAFDIQERAVFNTRRRLQELGLPARAELILDGHQNMAAYIAAPVNLIIFNLGYLPKGNHEITTKKDTTLQAVRSSLELLKPDGLVLIVLYPGHEDGWLEKGALERMTAGLEQKEYSVVQIRFANQINNPPELICIEKRITL